MTTDFGNQSTPTTNQSLDKGMAEMPQTFKDKDAEIYQKI